MLHSKYLTPEGMEVMLKTLYKNGWRYIFRKGCLNEFCASKDKPLYEKDNTPLYYPERKACLGNTLNRLMADAMKGYHYITIADHIGVVDWSTVKVDTPVLVKDYENNEWTKRHFACYVDGHVHAWIGGTTSWSADRRNDTMSWEYAKLAKDEEN